MQWADPGKRSKGNLKEDAVLHLTDISAIVEVIAMLLLCDYYVIAMRLLCDYYVIAM